MHRLPEKRDQRVAGPQSGSNGYDRMGRQTSTDYSDATADVSRTYDLAGRPATMVDSAGTVTYTLDNADRVTGIARTGGGSGLNGSFSYGYDDAGNITSRTLPDSSGSSYVFDDDGRLSTITTAAADTVLGYDAAGNLKEGCSAKQAATQAVAAAAGGGLLGGLTRRCPTPAANALSRIAPASIRFSQSSVNGVEKIAASMSRKGWVGDPIDVVRMTDGGLTAIDNTRVLAARRAGIDVQATIHGHADPLPSEYISRFTTRRGGVASTWGEAIANRIGAQSAKYRDSYPNGSPVTGWGGG